MIEKDYIEILRYALLSPYGVVIRYREEILSNYVRQNLYRVREKVRKKGDHQYDGLSIVLSPEGNLQIVKRKLTGQTKNDELERPYLQHLQKHELPDFVGSRGKAVHKIQ